MKPRKGKGKGKDSKRWQRAAIGILLALIMLLSVVSLITHSTTGKDVTETTIRNGYIVNPDNVTISMDGSTTPVLIGQNVQFMCEGNKSGPVTVSGVTGTPTGGYVFFTSNTGWLDTCVMTKEGMYNATYGVDWELLAVLTPVMGLRLKVGTKEVSSICSGTPLSVDFTSNLDENDCVDLRIIDPVGFKLTQNPADPNQKFDDINVSKLLEYGSENESKQINTSGWRLGEYEFSVRTEEENARGLDMSSDTWSLAILTAEVVINAEKTSIVELEKVKLVVAGMPNHNITINSSGPAHTIFPAGYEDNPPYDTSGFNDTLAADGQRRYVVYLNDTGTYTITVTDTTAGLDDDVDIDVGEKRVTFDVPATVVIGEKFTIKGMANTGDTVDIAVEDYVYQQLNDIVIKADGTFEEEIDTATTNITPFTVPGSVRLKAYIDRMAGVGDIGENETADGQVTILMVVGGITAELSSDNVAQGDDFTVSGTAVGSTSVDIVVVAPKGSGGSMIDPGGTPLQAGTNIYYVSSSVSEIDYTFSKKIRVGLDVDTGNYLVVVLTKGRDNEYGLGYDNLTAALAAYNLTNKTQAQVLAILEDATIDTVGSDDLLWAGYITVILIPHPYLNAHVSKSTVPPGDSFEVYGNASTDYVEIVAISPKGGNGTGMDGLYGVSIYTVPTFTEDTGSYKIIVHTKPEAGGNPTIDESLIINGTTNRENKTIIIITEEIDIEVETTAPSIKEKVLFTVKTAPYKLFNLSTTRPEDVTMTSYEDNPLGLPAGEEVPMDNKTYVVDVYGEEGKFSATTDENGTFNFTVYFTENGTYTFRVWYNAGTYANATGDERDDIDINVGEDGVTEFYKKIKVDSGADTGNYTILVLSPGIDGVYGNSSYKYIDSILDLDGTGPELGAIDVSNKTQEEILSIIADVTINQVGSDDLLWKGHLTVYQPKEIYVDDDFTDDPPNHRWNTIQEGINDANDGDMVYVYAGDYNENVIANKTLTLLGEGMPTIDAQCKGAAIKITANNCIVKGLKCLNGSSCEPKNGSGIIVESNGNIIENNTCGNNTYGIYLNSSNNVISNNTIYGKFRAECYSFNNTTVCYYEGWGGIYLYESTNNLMINNTIRGEVLTGIYLQNSSNNTILNNDIDNNYCGYNLDNCGSIYSIESSGNVISNNTCKKASRGVYIDKSSNNIVSNNTCKSNNLGIQLRHSSNNAILNNICEDNGDGILLSYSSENSILNNLFENNSFSGIRLFRSTSRNIISKNNCKNNHYGVFFHDELIIIIHRSENKAPSDNLLYLNNFINNSYNINSQAFNNIWNSTEKITYTYNGTTYTNYTGNYWSDYNGSDTNKDGIGDTPYNIDSDKDYYPLMKPFENYIKPEKSIFDTGEGTYPSICGTHNGTIIPTHDVNVSKLYTYPCPGTGGHTEYIKIWNNSGWNITANWNGYIGDWHNISFSEAFALEADEEYNYSIRTGSYPQIIHAREFNATGGIITCTEFVDANGKVYNDWIPAVRLWI